MRYPSRGLSIEKARRRTRGRYVWNGMYDPAQHSTAQHNTAHREAYTAHLTPRHPPLIAAPFTSLSPCPPHQPVKLPHGQHAERSTDPCPARRITRKYRNGVHPSTANRLTASSPKPQGSHTLPSPSPSPSPSHIPHPRPTPLRPSQTRPSRTAKSLQRPHASRAKQCLE